MTSNRFLITKKKYFALENFSFHPPWRAVDSCNLLFFANISKTTPPSGSTQELNFVLQVHKKHDYSCQKFYFTPLGDVVCGQSLSKIAPAAVALLSPISKNSQDQKGFLRLLAIHIRFQISPRSNTHVGRRLPRFRNLFRGLRL
jgi:hypothetical protein